MRFEWDENKRLSNIKKHGIDFLEIAEIFDTLSNIVHTPKNNEDRFKTTIRIKGRVVTIVFTLRENDVIRIISARRARKNEEKRHKKIEDCQLHS